MPYLPNLANLLNPGATFVGPTVTFVIEAQELGPVVVPTGQIVACDPLVFADQAAPFTVSVPPGVYTLRAWVAVLFQESGVEWQRRTAALQLVICDEPVVRWEPALVAGQDAASLADDEYFGYPVDAGAGTLADVAAVRALATWEFDRVDEVFIPAQLPPAPAAIGAVTVAGTGANVITVTTDWGDGRYPTFIGCTEASEPATFVTDFLVVPR